MAKVAQHVAGSRVMVYSAECTGQERATVQSMQYVLTSMGRRGVHFYEQYSCADQR